MKEYWRRVKAGELPSPKKGRRSQIVRRTVRCNSSWVRGGKVILALYPHGELGFREPRKRVEYKVSLAAAHRMAVQTTVGKMNARVKELRKQGHGLASARRQARKELGLSG